MDQHFARMHERDAITSQRLIHEMGRDEDRHLVAAGQLDEELPEPRETGEPPPDRSCCSRKLRLWLLLRSRVRVLETNIVWLCSDCELRI